MCVVGVCVSLMACVLFVVFSVRVYELAGCLCVSFSVPLCLFARLLRAFLHFLCVFCARVSRMVCASCSCVSTAFFFMNLLRVFLQLSCAFACALRRVGVRVCVCVRVCFAYGSFSIFCIYPMLFNAIVGRFFCI